MEDIIKKNIDALNEANNEYQKRIYSNNDLLRELVYKKNFSDLESKQLEIVNKYLNSDKFVFIWHVDYSWDKDGDPVPTDFHLDKLRSQILIGKLVNFEKSTEVRFSFLYRLDPCFSIKLSNRTDEGKYRIGRYPEGENKYFCLHYYRLNVFNKDTFKDEECIKHIKSTLDLINALK